MTLNLIFITITLAALVLFFLGTGRDKRFLLFSGIWLLLVGVVSYSGFFENTTTIPPRFLLVLAAASGLVVFTFRSVRNNPLRTPYLIAIHTLRLPVELVLFELFLQKQVPIFMTFKGWNFDIVMGISALLILAYLLITRKKLNKTFLLVWNIAGLLLLGTIVAVAILSSPLPLQQIAFDQPNIAVLQFPFSFLPAFVVPVVLLSHLLLLKNKSA